MNNISFIFYVYMSRHCGPELFCNLTCTSKHTLSFSKLILLFYTFIDHMIFHISGYVHEFFLLLYYIQYHNRV